MCMTITSRATPYKLVVQFIVVIKKKSFFLFSASVNNDALSWWDDYKDAAFRKRFDL